MDLDIQTMASGTLQNNVNRLLDEKSFAQSLRAQGLEIARTTQPKQTPTTQRWKISLRLLESGAEVPTKIEFSRRGLGDDRTLAPVDPEVIRAYRLYPVLVPHYTVHAVLAQKVSALSLREQVQSRDVFDLKLLLDAGGGERALPTPTARHLSAAIENAMAVDYDAFAGQVLAYLEPEYQEHYRSRQAWNALQEQVIADLEALRS